MVLTAHDVVYMHVGKHSFVCQAVEYTTAVVLIVAACMQYQDCMQRAAAYQTMQLLPPFFEDTAGAFLISQAGDRLAKESSRGVRCSCALPLEEKRVSAADL